jgi:hypothetical protein
MTWMEAVEWVAAGAPAYKGRRLDPEITATEHGEIQHFSLFVDGETEVTGRTAAECLEAAKTLIDRK